MSDDFAAQAAERLKSLSNGNGTTAPTTPPPQSMPPAPIDPERARMEWLEGYSGHLTGEKDPLAVSKVSKHYGRKVADFLSVVEHLERRTGRKYVAMRNWAYAQLRAQLNARPDLNKIAENLSRPSENRGFLARLLGKD